MSFTYKILAFGDYWIQNLFLKYSNKYLLYKLYDELIDLSFYEMGHKTARCLW